MLCSDYLILIRQYGKNRINIKTPSAVDSHQLNHWQGRIKITSSRVCLNQEGGT